MNFEKDITNCLQILSEGGLILYPTDTIWGIGCDATNPSAVEKIYQLKKRPDEKSMIILVADERNVLDYVAGPDPAVFEFIRNTERPTTIIYDGAIGLAHNLVSEEGTIAIRICKEPFCKQLLKRFRKPIVSTSANISGEPSPKIYKEIDPLIKNGVDSIVAYRQDDETISEPSSIIRWKNDGTRIVIR